MSNKLSVGIGAAAVAAARTGVKPTMKLSLFRNKDKETRR
jgi:hypothetical protein